MDIRRGLMMAMGNTQAYPNMVYHNTVTMEYTATNNNPFTLQLPIIGNYVIVTFIDTVPNAPDTGYIALSSCLSNFANVGQEIGQILRNNGTIGTDPQQIRYDKTTGILRFGGSYGAFPMGVTYHIYAFDVA